MTWAKVFGEISVPASRYVLSVGAVCGLSGCLVAVLVPASRLLRAAAADGLLPPSLATVRPNPL